MLIANGIIEKSGTAMAAMKPEGSLPEVEEMRTGIGRIEALVEANKTELAALLDDVVSLKNRVDEKLEKLVVIGKFAAVCLVVLAVSVVVGVVVGVIIMVLK